ncbi:hypothetical protein HH214_14490 [Mucilaginibacter robiniae]|uniref:Molecular chaperone n=1 Tax=Mucilaginibacter robiniae TaxID=2728022 RepID=A0A7L5E1S6_9SPHI|nr:hypothetical protein [Mucilaginibacter robiniae]QJD96991.1 hypothetical protein HH214_14490 [Mucilaginibacter robiniae]
MKLLKGCLIGLMFWVGFSMVPFTSFAQGSLAASPARLFFSSAAGQTVMQTVRLSNSGKSPIIVKASLQDWERDSVGAKVYYPAGKLNHSNAAWLKFSPEIIELQPGQERDVAVNMTIPQGADQASVKNCMLFFTQINEQKEATRQGQKQLAISIRFEVGIHIYYTPPALTKKELNVVAFEDRGHVENQEGTFKRLALVVKNTGEVNADARVHLEVTDAGSGEEFKFPDKPIAMLPGARQVVYIDIPAKLAGRKLVAVAMLDSGITSDLKVAEKAFDYVK